MNEEEYNGITGRLIDEIRTLNKQTSGIQITVAVIEERTQRIPEIASGLRDVENRVLTIEVEDNVRNKTVEKGRKSLRLSLYVIGSLITVGSAAYGAIVLSLAK